MASFGSWFLSGVVWVAIALAVGTLGDWLQEQGGAVATTIGWLFQISGFVFGGIFLWHLTRKSWYHMRGVWLATTRPEEFAALRREYEAAMQQRWSSAPSHEEGEDPTVSERVKALEHIKERIEALKRIDYMFADRVLTAAAEIMENMVEFPGLDFRRDSMTADRFLMAYKWILGQLSFSFFVRSTETRASVAALITRLTDDSPTETRDLWQEFERCLKDKNDEDDIWSLTAEIVSRRIISLFSGTDDAARVLTFCFVGPWDAMCHDLVRNFSHETEAFQ